MSLMARLAFLSLVCLSLVWGCGSVKNTEGPDAGDNANGNNNNNNNSSGPDAGLPDAAVCSCGQYEYCSDDKCEAAGVFFLNFDPQNDNFVYDAAGIGEDSALNRQQESEKLTGPLIGYSGDAAARTTILTAVQEDWAKYGVVVTSTRPPANVDYHMIVLTGSDPEFGVPLVTLGTINCNNANKRNVDFVFDVPPGPDLATLANLVSYRMARTIGLDKVDAQNDLLHQFFPDPNAGFTDACHSIPSTNTCSAQHQAYCAPGFQNSHAELAGAFGLK
jgi:hypothetical protein